MSAWTSRSISGSVSRRAVRSREAAQRLAAEQGAQHGERGDDSDDLPRTRAASSPSARQRRAWHALERLERPPRPTRSGPPARGPGISRRPRRRRSGVPGRSLSTRRRVVAQDRRQERRHGLALERAAAREHLVEHRAEREDVGARVDGLAARLLRRHVGGRAEHDSGPRGAISRQRGGRPGARGAGHRRQLREAEVEHLDLARRREHDVGRLDVAVDDPRRVRGRERARDVHRVAQRLVHRQRPLREQAVERAALHVLHRDAVRAVGRLVDVVDGDDVRVIERRGGAGLADEARATFGVVERVAAQQLQRDGPGETGVARPVEHAHPSLAELLEDLVATAGRCRHGALRDCTRVSGGVRS